MTIRLATEQDKYLWDSYIKAHHDVAHVHLWHWKKVIEDTYSKKSYYLIAEQQDKIVGVLPLFHIKSLFFGNELVSMPYSTYGGVIADSTDVQIQLIKAGLDIANSKNVAIIKLRQSQMLSKSTQNNFKNDNSKVSMRLKLPEDSKDLFENLKAKVRSQIRRPQKEGMKFKMGGMELVNDFYKVFTINMRDLGSPVHSKNLFINLLKRFKDSIKVGTVYYNSVPVAAGIISTINKFVEIPWASSLRKYNRYSPNMLLYWSFLEYCCNNGFKVFDFGRSTPGEGTYKFKEQWGASPYSLLWYNFSVNEKHESNEQEITESSFTKLFVSIWSRFPVVIANNLGQRIRKNISL